jgi:phosphoribosylformimino-5-aminoimidazole carboxamide ribotide isomerase
MTIAEVPLEIVWQMRRDIMYPEHTIEMVRLDNDDEGTHIGIYLGGEVVSVISLFFSGGELQFRKLATRVQHQGKGFAKSLLRHVFHLAKEKNCNTVWCNARTTALALYEKFGMQVVGDTWMQHGHTFVKMIVSVKGTKLDNIVMDKNTTGAASKSQGFIIPAIDIIDGKCVRLSQGDYAQKKIYNEHPLEVALQFEDAGIKRLHLVDLDGAKAGKVINWKVLENIASKTKLIIDFGGGIKGFDDLKVVFESGAALATIGSLAVKDEALFTAMIKQYGADKFFLGADVKNERIAISGWLEQTNIFVYDFINQYKTLGLAQFFCTDIAKDGMMEGPSLELYKTILKECEGIQLTASGGVSNIDDLYKLKEAGCAAAIVGKAIYEGSIAISELSVFA